jgi:hypothetical protein
LPVGILAGISAPAFGLLFTANDLGSPELTVKVTGSQWFWSYEYDSVVGDPFSPLQGVPEGAVTHRVCSRLVQEEDLLLGQIRLLQTDGTSVLPARTGIRFLVTSADVLHSWSVPSLGVKIDACPGRLNQVVTYLLRGGTFYGQCSELCGVLHGFMPVVVQALDYQTWVEVATLLGSGGGPPLEIAAEISPSGPSGEITPVDSEGEITPVDSEGEITPVDSEGEITPVDPEKEKSKGSWQETVILVANCITVAGLAVIVVCKAHDFYLWLYR